MSKTDEFSEVDKFMNNEDDKLVSSRLLFDGDNMRLVLMQHIIVCF